MQGARDGGGGCRYDCRVLERPVKRDRPWRDGTMAQTETTRFDALFSSAAKRLPAGARGRSGPDPNRVNFSGGSPDPLSMPKKEMAAAAVRALEKRGEWALQYGAATGYAGLIDQLLVKLKRDNGVEARPENVLITAGAS